MKNLKYLLLVAMFSMALISCKKKEADLTPSAIEVQYKLPQGNHDYDPTLVSLNQRYGTFFLYKWTAVDFAANPVYTSGGFNEIYTADNADEAYVGKLLTFIQKNWLNHYSDAFLKANLPYKVLFAQNMRLKSSPTTKYTVLSNYNQITVSNVSADFDAMTAAQKKTYVNTLHTEFFNFIFNRGKVDIPLAFTTVTNYTAAATATNYYSLGYVSVLVALQGDKLNRDFLSYIALITSRTKAELDASILSPTTDTSGLIRKKYDIIINYYKTKYNVDLQAIGNAGVIN